MLVAGFLGETGMINRMLGFTMEHLPGYTLFMKSSLEKLHNIKMKQMINQSYLLLMLLNTL